MAKTVLGKGLTALLKKSTEASESTPEPQPSAQEQANIISPGVRALLQGGGNGQPVSMSEPAAQPGWLACWPWVRAILWGGDVILICLSTALTLTPSKPSLIMVVLSALGFLAGAGLASLAVAGEGAIAALRKQDMTSGSAGNSE